MTDVSSTITDDELELLQEAFFEGRYDGMLEEHEGATRTFMFEAPSGYVGLSVALAGAYSDVCLSVSRWEKRQHHEIESWYWERVEE